MKNTIKGILFDLDGTILNTQKMNIIPLQKLILEELGKEISYDNLIKYCAYPGKQTIKMLGFKILKTLMINGLNMLMNLKKEQFYMMDLIMFLKLYMRKELK